MSKTTPDSLERDLKVSLDGYKTRALAAKDEHRAKREAIMNDPRATDLGKRERLADLATQTRTTLDDLKAAQESYVTGLRARLERELLGHQPTDANSIMLRRDAADRARRIGNEEEALAVLSDAVRSGDDSLTHAVGYRARQSAWGEALNAYQQAQPGAADTAGALAVVESLERDTGYNLSNQITYAAPID